MGTDLSTVDRPVRVGVVGAGAMGTSHLRMLAAWVPGARVVSVYDADPARSKDAAGEVGAEPADDAASLIASPEVDAVVIAAPDPLHEELALACVEAGKPTLCEKPLATTSEGTQRVVDAELAAGRRLVQVGFMRRYDPGFVELREQVVAGEVGAVRVLHCIHRNPQAHPTATSDGIVTNSMIHELDTVPWLLDDPISAVTVMAPGGVPEGELKDPQVAVLETAGGVLVTVEVFVNARYGYDVHCEVVGDAATLRLAPPYGLSRRRYGTDGRLVTDDFVRRFADAYRIELADWVAGAREGVVRGPNAWDGHRATLVAEAGIESLHTGGRVAVGVVEPPDLYR